MMRIRRQIVIWLLPVLVVLPAARATMLARLSIEQLAAGSDAVARVSYAGSISQWENDSIWTATTFQVTETLKGDLPAQVTVRLPGGRAGHLTAAVDGVPKFRPGDDAFLFLQHSRSGGGFTVAGWVEGTFRVARDPHNGAESVTQDSAAFAVFDRAARAFHAEGIRRMPIDAFRARVAAALASSREKAR